MKVTVINGHGSDEHEVMVHKAGCRDTAKYDKVPASSPAYHEHWDEEATSKQLFSEDYNSDFLDAQGEGGFEIYFYPCTEGLAD